MSTHPALRGAHRGLPRALERSARSAGVPFEIESHHASAWHSITFSGERHRIEARAMVGRDLDRWLAGLDARSVDLPGEMLADLALSRCVGTDGVARMRIEGLTVRTDREPVCAVAFRQP